MTTKDRTRTEAIRRRANEERRRDEALRKRRRLLVQIGVVVGGALIVVGGVLAVTGLSSQAREASTPSIRTTVTVAGTAAVPFVVEGSTVRIGEADAPVELSIYEDFSCLHCQDLDAAIEPVLPELIASGDVAVEYHPMRVVTNFGTRAGCAATCVAVGSPENWMTVHAALFAAHDAASDAWSYSDLRGFVADLGVTDEATLDCIESGRYAPWIEQNTRVAAAEGVTATPTLLVNGEASDIRSAEALTAAVDAILATDD
ncbi:DsbA family protein [Agromyces atrinae]|uniref:thioredoxin domain-containing protein n=1 Tax=Agromyces atrinae TaxID=592376 RepID=UPI001F599531|nr:thioredoxin domain-containing protein [Agromyces atrinae]MCI2956714.1 DsbA family protein [Agromyces atrinae]